MGSQRVGHDWAAAQRVYGSPTWQVWDLILLWLCPSCHLTAGSFLSVDMGDLFLVGSSILLSMAVQQLVVILVLLQEEMSACPTLPSWTESPAIIYLYMFALLLFFPSAFQLPAVRSYPLALNFAVTATFTTIRGKCFWSSLPGFFYLIKITMPCNSCSNKKN